MAFGVQGDGMSFNISIKQMPGSKVNSHKSSIMRLCGHCVRNICSNCCYIHAKPIQALVWIIKYIFPATRKGRMEVTFFKNKKTITNRRLIDAKENLLNDYKRDKDQPLIIELIGKTKER